MFCIHCGNQIPDESAFCIICGKSVPKSTYTPPVQPSMQAQDDYLHSRQAAQYTPPAYSQTVQSSPVTPQYIPNTQRYAAGHSQWSAPSPAAAPTSGKSSTVRICLGIALLLCSVLPYLLHSSIASTIRNAVPNLNSYGNAVISVITAFSGLFGQLEALLRFPAFLSAVITGIALLQNRPKTKTAAIICGIFNTLAALSFASMLLLCTQPQWILSLYFSEGSSPEYLAVLDQFFILDDIRGAIRFFTAVTAILAGISFGSLFTLRNNYTGTPLRSDRSLSGLFILLPFLVIYQLLSILLPTILTGTVMGSSALAALSFANSVSAYHFTALFTWLFLLVLVLSVIFRKPPFSWSALAVGGGLLLCIAGLCLPIPDFRVYNVPESIIEMVNSYYQVKLLGSALLLIAFSLWCVAITRNTIPLWLQWVLPCVIIPLYLLAEVFTCVIMQLSSPGMGQIICAIPILIVTITVGFLRAGRKYK